MEKKIGIKSAETRWQKQKHLYGKRMIQQGRYKNSETYVGARLSGLEYMRDKCHMVVP